MPRLRTETAYRVLVGISYGSPEKYAPVGSIVDDIPASEIAWMLADRVIEEVPSGDE